MAEATQYGVGLLGLGTVGSQVAERLEKSSDMVNRRTGVDLALRRVLVRDLAKARRYTPAAALTSDAADVLDDPSVDIIVEVIGGVEPAHEYLRRAITAGKHIVTANKEVMAKYGPDLLELALEHEVDIYFEAAVGGGIPLISTFKIDLLANEINSIEAIINGTTNYILDGMAQGKSYTEALDEARRLGFAEADPSSDVDGHDSVYKLCILSSIAFSSRFHPTDIYREGITELDPKDFGYAAEMGYAIKLVAEGRKRDGAVELRVHPTLIKHSHLLSKVGGSNQRGGGRWGPGRLGPALRTRGGWPTHRQRRHWRPHRPGALDAKGRQQPHPDVVRPQLPGAADGGGGQPRLLPHGG